MIHDSAWAAAASLLQTVEKLSKAVALTGHTYLVNVLDQIVNRWP